MSARSPLVSESARVLRVALVGAIGVTAAWFIGASLGGLVRFMLVVAAVLASAVTIGLLVNQAIDRTTDHRRRKAYRDRFSEYAPGGTGLRRCGSCRRILMHASGVWLCPHCDDPELG